MQRTFPVVPNDNEAALFYDEFTYLIASIIGYLAYIIAGLSLLLFVVGIFARKIIGVEMMGVIQISYLSLLCLDSMNPCFKMLANIWFVNGFNYFSLTKNYLTDVNSPIQIKGIFLYSRFMENYNFTMLLILIPYLISLVCLILSVTLYSKD